jgi:hypothetical protein
VGRVGIGLRQQEVQLVLDEGAVLVRHRPAEALQPGPADANEQRGLGLAACRQVAEPLRDERAAGRDAISMGDLGMERPVKSNQRWLRRPAARSARRLCRSVTCWAIPWGEIVSARNRLIHGYDFVDLDILWEIVATG